jgi:hypothetical protein
LHTGDQFIDMMSKQYPNQQKDLFEDTVARLCETIPKAEFPASHNNFAAEEMATRIRSHVRAGSNVNVHDSKGKLVSVLPAVFLYRNPKTSQSLPINDCWRLMGEIFGEGGDNCI